MRHAELDSASHRVLNIITSQMRPFDSAQGDITIYLTNLQKKVR